MSPTLGNSISLDPNHSSDAVDGATPTKGNGQELEPSTPGNFGIFCDIEDNATIVIRWDLASSTHRETDNATIVIRWSSASSTRTAVEDIADDARTIPRSPGPSGATNTPLSESEKSVFEWDDGFLEVMRNAVRTWSCFGKR